MRIGRIRKRRAENQWDGKGAKQTRHCSLTTPRALDQDFLAGTFLPSFRASESPMAIACLRLLTFLPLRPDFSLPRFISCISRSTLLPAEGEYLRPDDFFEVDFFEADFLAAVLRDLREPELPDFFLVAFLVAMTILLGGQMASELRQVAQRQAKRMEKRLRTSHIPKRR